MLENARYGGCQQVRVQLEIEERCVKHSDEAGWRRDRETETGLKLKTSLASM